MEKTFEYYKELRANDSITIENVGDCCIKAYNDDGWVYYLLIKTTLGWTKIYQYGALSSDTLELSSNYCSSVQQVEYSDKVLSKLINSFLNDKNRKITQVFECNEEEFITNCKSII